MPIEEGLMKYQLDLALDGLRSNELAGMILLGSPVIDLPLDSVNYARRWLKRHSDESIRG